MSDTNEPSPRPWRVAESVCGWQNCIEDANGNDIGSCWYNRDRLRAEADAALIVDAVNFYDATVDTQLTALLAERDRLRDALKRIIDATYDIDMGCPDYRAIARAALGEDAP